MGISHISLTALAVGLALSTAGCKPGIEKVVVGHWKGTLNVAGIANMSPAMKAMISPDLSLDVREDKTYSLTMSIPMEGKWEAKDGKLTLHPEKFMGSSFEDFKGKAAAFAQASPDLKGQMGNLDHLNQPMVCAVAEDGKSISLDGTTLSKSQ